MSKHAFLFSDHTHISSAIAAALAEANYSVDNIDDSCKEGHDPVSGKTPDLLVNVVSNIMFKDYLDVALSDFDSALLKILKQVFFITQKVAGEMVSNHISGTIINVFPSRSRELYPADSLGTAIYSAMEQFTRAAALDLSKHEIHAAGIAYDMNEKLRFHSTPRDIARSVVFLSSLSSFTGEILFLDGGATLPVVTENEYVSNPWRR